MNDKENISLMSDLASDLGDLKISSAHPPNPASSTPQRKPLSTVFHNVESPAIRPSEILGTNSPKKGTSTRVIESLHGEIDDLKLEIAKLKNNNEELKKSNEITKKRRDQLVEQLSNTKHENDTMHAILKRKETRIKSLEEQLDDVSNSSDDFRFKLQNLQTRYDKLRDSEASSTSEFERLKIAYDTIVSSQKEYRSFYTTEIKELKEKLDTFTQEKQAEITKNISLINKSDATIYRSIKSITLRSREIEEKFVKRDEIQLRSFAELTQRLDQHSYDIEGLLKFSKELFHEIAAKSEIDKEELLKQYLDEFPDRKDPFESIIEEPASEQILLEETENQQPETISKSTTDAPIVLKKRPERTLSIAKNATQRTLSVEQRITSLGKELNSMIPLKDRTTNVEPIGRKRHSRQPSRSQETLTLQSRIASGTGTTDSRRSSRIFDSSEANNDLASRIGTVGKHSRTSSISTDIPQQISETVEETLDKPKRRRQRRRKNKKPNTGAADQSFEYSGNDSN